MRLAVIYRQDTVSTVKRLCQGEKVGDYGQKHKYTTTTEVTVTHDLIAADNWVRMMSWCLLLFCVVWFIPKLLQKITLNDIGYIIFV